MRIRGTCILDKQLTLSNAPNEKRQMEVYSERESGKVLAAEAGEIRGSFYQGHRE